MNICRRLNFLKEDEDLRIFVFIDVQEHDQKIETTIFESKNGVDLYYPVIGLNVVDSLPALSGSLAAATLTIVKHFRDNGFQQIQF